MAIELDWLNAMSEVCYTGTKDITKIDLVVGIDIWGLGWMKSSSPTVATVMTQLPTKSI